jgi:hypothetical protein
MKEEYVADPWGRKKNANGIKQGDHANKQVSDQSSSGWRFFVLALRPFAFSPTKKPFQWPKKKWALKM